MVLSRVVFPQPDGPTMAIKWPRGIFRLARSMRFRGSPSFWMVKQTSFSSSTGSVGFIGKVSVQTAILMEPAELVEKRVGWEG